MLNEGSLGSTGGARGVDAVRQAVRTRPSCDPRPCLTGQRIPIAVYAKDVRRGMGLCQSTERSGSETLRGDENPRLGIGDHEPDARRRETRVQWHIGAAGL